MRFETSIEASEIINDLREQLKTVRYNPDLKKMLKNIELMSAEMSMAEVKARQLHRPGLVDPPREKLTVAIDYLEKLLLMMRLLD